MSREIPDTIDPIYSDRISRQHLNISDRDILGYSLSKVLEWDRMVKILEQPHSTRDLKPC